MNLDDLTPQQLEDATHSAVCNAGFAFTQAVWGDRSITEAWPHVDPLLRRCWAQAWLQDQRDAVRADGYDPDAVVEAFTAEQPEHPLWPVFEGLQLAVLLHWAQGVHEWGASARHIVVGLDLELLYMLPKPAEGDVASGEVRMPLLMSYDESVGWRVLNFLSEQPPVPGWPPQMGAAEA